MRQYQPEPRSYELMTILSPDVPDDEIQNQLTAITGYITTAGGTVADVNRESPWGRRRLAYAIRHNGRDVRDGFYTVFHFAIAPTRIVEVEREIKLNDQIIRHLITHYQPPAVTAPAEGGEEQPTEGTTEVVATPASVVAAEPVAVEAPAVAATEAPAEGEETPAAAEVASAEPVAAEAESTAEVAEEAAPESAAASAADETESEESPAQPATSSEEG